MAAESDMDGGYPLSRAENLVEIPVKRHPGNARCVDVLLATAFLISPGTAHHLFCRTAPNGCDVPAVPQEPCGLEAPLSHINVTTVGIGGAQHTVLETPLQTK